MFRLLQSQLDPQRKQRSKLLEIGVYLQKNRLEQSLSLEDIAQKTLIPRHRLEALEAGDLEALPEPLLRYRRYCHFDWMRDCYLANLGRSTSSSVS